MKIFLTKNAVKELISIDSLPLYMVMSMDVIGGTMHILTFQKDLTFTEKIVKTLGNGLKVGELGQKAFDAYRQIIFNRVKKIDKGIGFDVPDEQFSIEVIKE